MTEYNLTVGTTLYADIAARTADTPFNTNAENINKVVRVVGPPTDYFALLAVPNVYSAGFLGTSFDPSPVIMAAQFTPEVDYIFYNSWVAQQNILIIKGSLFAVVAPTGSAILVDILINDAVQTRILTLAAGVKHQLTDITNLSVTAGQKIGVKITQIGSTNPGNGLIATLYHTLP